MSVPQLTREDTVLLVIDIQQNLLPHIDNHQQITQRASVLIRGSALLDLPIIVTEQYPNGIGPTADAITSILPDNTPILEKITFSKFRNNFANHPFVDHTTRFVAIGDQFPHLLDEQSGIAVDLGHQQIDHA